MECTDNKFGSEEPSTNEGQLRSERGIRFSVGAGAASAKFDVDVTVIECLDSEETMFTWPSAYVLGAYLACFPEKCSGMTFLEIGCGTAVPSIVAAKLGELVSYPHFHYAAAELYAYRS
jgi:hypothetical protein